MPTAKDIKDERIEFRVSSEMKTLIQQAASLQGISTSDFVAATAYREARKAIEDHEVIRLTREESERFVELLLSPTPPNERLRNLMKGDESPVH
jgi:uncharacterized protein (DUF1778 family)